MPDAYEQMTTTGVFGPKTALASLAEQWGKVVDQPELSDIAPPVLRPDVIDDGIYNPYGVADITHPATVTDILYRALGDTFNEPGFAGLPIFADPPSYTGFETTELPPEI